MDKRDENLSTSSDDYEEVITSSDNDKSKPGLYIIYSRWSLSRIDKKIKLLGDIGLLRIICDAGKETNRTLALLENDVYNKLCEEGYADKKGNKGFNIVRFNEKVLDLPSKGCSRNLFIPVPEIFRKDDMKTIDIIDDKLKHLVGWEVLPKDSWHVNALLESREKGAISSGCFIVFDNKIEITTIAKVKMLITDTLWPLVEEDIEREYFKCMWAFDSKKRDQDKKPERKFKTDDKRPERKFKSEEKEEKEQEGEAEEQKPVRKFKPKEKEERKLKPKEKEGQKPERRFRSEVAGKKYVRKIKDEDEDDESKDETKDQPTVTLSIPTISQPVEMLDDIVIEENDS